MIPIDTTTISAEEKEARRKIFQKRRENWNAVIKMAKKADGLKSSICEGCGSGRLRNDAGDVFVITRNTNLQDLEVKIKQMQQCQKAQ